MNKVSIRFLSSEITEAPEGKHASFAMTKLNYEVALEVDDGGSFLTDAHIEFSPMCYCIDEYEDQPEVFSGKRYINDAPSVHINSWDCFDNGDYFTVEVYCEITKLLLEHFNSIKSQFVV